MRSPTFLYTALIFGVSAIAIPALALKADAESPAKAKDPIAAAVTASTRTPANVARDAYRHPVETLNFFGVKPGQTVVEYSPAGGWYTEILAPLLKDKGVFYAAQAPGRGFDALKAKLAADPATYGKVKLVPWAAPQSVIPAGSADVVVTFRNIHNMVMNGTEAAQFKAFFDVLKPGGTLGIVDHRLPEDRDIAAEKSSGYLKVSTVRRIAEAAGFTYAGASEVNANPKDSADWPDGVWTLPPSLAKGTVDKERYLAIGESDRMTLRFTKPAK
jgi:predicted methyltransferase